MDSNILVNMQEAGKYAGKAGRKNWQASN